MTSSMPSSAATRSAVARLSPESMTGRTPSSRSAPMASAAVSRGASAMAMTAAALPSMATCTLVRPWPASSSERAARPSRRDAFALQQAGVADGEAVAVDGGEQSVARDGLEGLGARHLQAALGRGLDDGLGQRVLAVALGGGDEAQHLVLVDAVGGRDLDDLGLAARERAGLVEDDGVERGRLLERHRVLEQDAALGAEPGADHDGRRRREPERVRAGDDDDGDGEQQRVLDVAADDEVPDDEGQRCRRRARRARARRRRGRRGAGPGALEFCASWTSLTICASAVSEPTAVARARSVPFLLMVAPMSWSPGGLLDRAGSRR